MMETAAVVSSRESVCAGSITNPICDVLARLLRRIGGGIGDPSYGFGGRESNALVVQYVQRSDLHKLYLK